MIPSQRTLKLLIPLVVLIALSCTNNRKLEKEDDKTEVQINEYTAKYAGGYTVELEGVNSDDAAEIYILRNDGSAKWIYLKNDGTEGGKIESEKSGNWSATDKSISITCEGNSGPITENFEIKNGVFYDTMSGDRFLKPKQ